MAELQVPDSEIIARVLKGDTDWFETLVRRYQDRVLRLCASFLGDFSAEDAAQEIFLKVYRSLDHFRSEASFSTWIYRIASNHCLSALAAKRREKTESLDALTERGGDFISSKEALASRILEDRQAVSAALDRMDPDERAILTLREMEGLSYKELSEALEISMDLVKVRLFRARKSFLELAKPWL